MEGVLLGEKFVRKSKLSTVSTRAFTPLHMNKCHVNVRIVKIFSARSLHSLSDYLLIECPLMFIVMCTHTCTNHEVHV